MCACLSHYTYFPFHSLTGNHTIAVIKGQESYELLKSSCCQLFKSINKITRNGKINVDDYDIMVEMFLGGDYKVLELTIILNNLYNYNVLHACQWS